MRIICDLLVKHAIDFDYWANKSVCSHDKR